ncbi:MAG: low temperature requirement protein [Conexibacter sp.]|nr:low temperature requirement protein [Conexibacter sp.]
MPPFPPAEAAAAPATAAPAEPEQRVSALELFFDLVFVFAITQVTQLIAHDPDWTHLLEGLAILVAIWWAWECYAWLGNTAASDEGAFRVTLLAAMGAMLVAAIAVPHAFGRDALAFGIAYCAVRVLHLGAYKILARTDRTLDPLVGQLARTMFPAGLLLVAAGLVDGPARTVCWAMAIALDLGGLVIGGVEGWRVEAGHLAERHGLIVIIALGESIVALGVGAEGQPLDAGLILAVLLGVATAAALWWAYFDVVAIVAERRFRQATGLDRVLIARDSYTYLHLPMVAGIILFSLGVKKTLPHVGDELGTIPAVGLCGGVALYFLAHVAFRLRNVRTLNRGRLASAIVLVALIPVATAIPALASLAAVAAISVGLMAYEFVHFHEARERLRHTLG